MTTFYVTKGYRIPVKVHGKKKCRIIEREQLGKFWESVAERQKRGCYVWTCPGLMDTPKSVKVRAQGVHGGEGRETEAAEVFG